VSATGSLQFSDRNFRFGPFELFEREGELRKNGVRIKLQEQPFQVLHELVANAGKVVTREELQQRLWPADTFVDFNVGVNTAIRKLRLALNDDADNPHYIETVSKRGYRFIAEVSVQQANTLSLLTENSSGSVSLPPIVIIPRERSGSATGVAEVLELADTTSAEAPAREAPRLARRNAIRAIAVLLLAAAGGLVYYAMQPYPVPQVKRYKALTNDGQIKEAIGLDGARLYMGLVTLDYYGMAELSTSGGDIRKTPLLPDHSAYPMQISPDGSQLLIVDPSFVGPAPFYSVPILGGPPRRIGDVKGDWAQLSSDGKRLVYQVKNSLYVADADGSNSRLLVSLPKVQGTGSPVWSPEGRRIRFSVVENIYWVDRLWEVNADGTGLHQLLPGFTSGSDREWAGRWSPDSRYFYFNCNDQICVLPEKRSFLSPQPKPVQLTSGPTILLASAVSPDNRWLYATGITHRGELVRYDLQSGLYAPAFGGGISAEFVSFSPDGRSATYVTYPEGTLWRCRADGSGLQQLTSPADGYAIAPRWSPDGKSIYYTVVFGTSPLSSKMFQVSVDGGRTQQILPDEKQSTSDPGVSPDGKKLIFAKGLANRETSIQILDQQTMQVSTLPDSKGKFSPRLVSGWSPHRRPIVR
jgi:Tol biopolymer transport system component/DNA-binding winged helix-turn-helix (wHTH) protein